MRPAFDALFAIDDALAAVVLQTRDPTLAAIKLAWWREQLEGLDRQSPPAEPRLQAASRELLPRGVNGADLAALEDGWAALLQQTKDPGSIAARGTVLFRIGAHLLQVPFDDVGIGAAGRLFAAVDSVRRGLVRPPGSPVLADCRFPRPARALTGLAALAARDARLGGPPFEAEATPGRAWTLLRHRLTGRL